MSIPWPDVESPMPAAARKCESLRTQHFLWVLATWKRQVRRYGRADLVVRYSFDRLRELAAELIGAGCAPVCPPPINKGAPASVARPGSPGGQGGTSQSAFMSNGLAAFGSASSGTSTHLNPGGGAPTLGFVFRGCGGFRRRSSYSSMPSLMALLITAYASHASSPIVISPITVACICARATSLAICCWKAFICLAASSPLCMLVLPCEFSMLSEGHV